MEWTAQKRRKRERKTRVSRKEAAAEIESDGRRKEIADELVVSTEKSRPFFDLWDIFSARNEVSRANNPLTFLEICDSIYLSKNMYKSEWLYGIDWFLVLKKTKNQEETNFMSDTHEQIRIVQENVAGKEVTFAHVIGGPAPIIYQKLGLNPSIDYGSTAIGIMNMTPPESAVIAADIAVKSGNVYLGFADRFTGTLIVTGDIADVTAALNEVVQYFRDVMKYVVCEVTKR